MTKQRKILLRSLLKEYKQQLKEQKQFGIQYSQFDRNDRLVKKQKIFDTKQKLDKFIAALQKKDNFNKIQAWLNQSKQQRYLIKQGSDWIVLKSIKMYIDNRTGNFLNLNDPMEDWQPYNSPRWNKYYNQLSSDEKNTVNKLKNQYKWKIKP